LAQLLQMRRVHSRVQHLQLVRDIGGGTSEATIGLKLMQTLVKGIDGTLRIESAEGTHVEVTFPL
jgi:two-component sensor histidine kinase